MHEKLVIVPKRKTTAKKILNITWFVLACLMLVLSMWVNPILFFIPAVVFGVLWYYTGFKGDIEYEYTYYDGELRFARIKAKSRRKGIAKVQMEDVLAFAPKGDRSVYKYENDRNLPCKNIASGNSDARVYELVCKGEKGLLRYEFEPDEEMLDEIMVKYPRSVIK